MSRDPSPTERADPGFRPSFDAAAADFDRLGTHVWAPIGATTVEAARPRGGDRVLDACCGTGASALPAAVAVGAEGTVDAVDSSAPMIEVLRRSAATLPQLHGHTADVLGWNRQGYDVVQAALGIFFFPDMTAGTDHLISLARPGGRVAFTIWRSGAMETAGKHLWRAVTAVTGAETPARRRHLINEINQPDSYRAWLEERDLSDVEVAVDVRRIPLTDELAWLIITGSGYRGAITDLDAHAIAAVREHYLTSLADDGVTEIDATTLIGTGQRAG